MTVQACLKLSTRIVGSCKEVAIDFGEVLIGATREIGRKDDMIENAP
jgi:hypothetical protein